MKENISNLLIGNKGNYNKNKFSNKLIGNIKDKDRDGYPMGFSKFVDDCNDKNKNKDGWVSNVVNKVKSVVSPPKPAPKPSTPAPTPYAGSKLQQTVSPGAKSTISTPTPSAAPKPSTPAPQKTTTRTGGGGSQTIQQITTPTPNALTPYITPTTKTIVDSKTTTSTPTPSAETLSGSTQQREQQIIAYQQQVAQQKLYEDYQSKVQKGEIAGMTRYNSQEEAKKLLLAKGNFIPQTQKSQAEYMVYTTPQPFKQPTRIQEVIPESYENIEVRKARGLTGEIKEDIKPYYEKVKQSKVGRVIAGDIGEAYTGIYLSPKSIAAVGVTGGLSLFTPLIDKKPLITAKRIQSEVAKREGFIPVSGLIPTTPLGVATTIGIPGGLGYLSKGGKIAKGISYGVDIGFIGLSGYELKRAETTKEKIGATLGLGLGIAGLTSTKGIKAELIAESISKAETKLISKGFIKTKDLSKFNLDEAEKIKLENLMNSGYSVRESELSLVPKKGLEQTTPKVSGKVLELINQNGDVAERIAVGRDIKIELGKKKVTQDIYSETLMKLEEGKVTGITDVVTRTRQQKVIGIGEQAYPKNKISISRLTEETEQIGQAGKGKVQSYYSQTKTGLLQQDKYTGQPTILKQFQNEKIKAPMQKEENTMILYHVTSKENIPGILKEGLKPSKGTGIHGVIGESDRVYTTLSKPVAEKYNIMLGGKGKILEIKVPKEEVFTAIREDAKVRTGVGQIGQVTFSFISPDKISAPGMTRRNGTYLQILPDFQQAIKLSKPRSISKSIEVQKQVSTKGLTLKDSEAGFLLGERFFETKGKSVSKNIFEQSKTSKPTKPFKLIEETKPSKEYQQPEIKTEAKQILEEQKPTYVGGESAQTNSLFYGKGGTKGIIRESIYQSAPQLGQRDLTSLKGKGTATLRFNLTELPQQRTTTQLKPMQVNRLFSTTETTQEEKSILKESSGTIQILKPTTKEDTLLREGLKEIEKTKLEQKTQQKTKQITRQQTPIRPTFTFDFPEEVTPRITPTFKPKSKERPRRKKYLIEIRRRGEFIPVGETSSLGQAFGVGVSRVKSSLAASFRIRESGKKEAVKFNLNLPEFRSAKKESGVVVQRRGFRLGSLFERTEIQQARKKKVYI